MRIKIVIFLLIIALFIGGGTFYFYYQKNNNFGTLKIKTFPLLTTIKIDDKLYPVNNGNLEINLKEGKHQLTIFSNGYLNYQKEIEIKKGETLNLENVYLLPLSFKKTVLIEDDGISFFTLSQNNNRLLYLKKVKDKSGKINYEWFIYDRNTKTTQKIYQSQNLPLKINFLTNKILTEIKENNWQIIFSNSALLRDLNIFSQSLNSLFEKQLINLKPKLNKNIKEAVFTNEEENELILQTEEAIFLINLREDKLELVYEGKASPFIFSNPEIYFIDKSGLLSKISLSTKNFSSLSLFNFKEDDLSKFKIVKSPVNNSFLIIDSNNKLYYLNLDKSLLPLLVRENIEEANFSFLNNSQIILKEKGINSWEIYGLENKQSSKMDSLIPPSNFITSDFWLVLQNNQLKIYNLKENKFYLIDDKIDSNFIYVDNVLKQIFYLKDNKIIVASY